MGETTSHRESRGLDIRGIPWMNEGAIDDCLPEELNIPHSNWLRVGQFLGKHLHTPQNTTSQAPAESSRQTMGIPISSMLI